MDKVLPQLAFAVGIVLTVISMLIVFQGDIKQGRIANKIVAECQYELSRRESCTLIAVPVAELEIKEAEPATQPPKPEQPIQSQQKQPVESQQPTTEVPEQPPQKQSPQ